MKKQKESVLMSSCVRLLTFYENLGRLIFIRNNTGAMKVDKRFIRFGKKGSPDLYIFCKDGKTLHIELKTPKGRQSPSQKDYEANISNLGHLYFVVRDTAELEKILHTGKS